MIAPIAFSKDLVWKMRVRVEIMIYFYFAYLLIEHLQVIL